MAAVLPPSAAAPPMELSTCRGLAGAARTQCIRAATQADRAATELLHDLDGWIADDPALVLEALDAARIEWNARLDADPRLDADLLERRGSAFRQLGQPDQAAATWRLAAERDDGTARVRWLADDGTEIWSTPLEPTSDRQSRLALALEGVGRRDEAEQLRSVWRRLAANSDHPTALLEAPIWLPLLPALDVELFGAEPLALREQHGKVVLIEVWATWCQPCLQTLPRLEQLHAAQRDHGLVALALNAGEPPGIARTFAQSLGLTLPIGRFDDNLDLALRVRALPSVVLADREGRIRRRWHGVKPGEVDEISAQVVELLAEPAGTLPAEEVAAVATGHGLMQPIWTRELPSSIEGVLILPDTTSLSPIVVAAGRSTLRVGPDGGGGERFDGSLDAGQLRLGGRASGGTRALVGFRRGSSKLVSFADEGRSATSWSAPAEVLDLEFDLPTTAGEAQLLLATTAGLWRVARVGAAPVRVEGLSGEVSAVTALPDSADARFVVLSPGGDIAWLDGDLRPLRRRPAPPGGWHLFAARGLSGTGVAPAGVVAIVTGSFFPGTGTSGVMATASGQVVSFDLRTGAELWRARWPQVVDLAAHDFDGDGLDELLVASGRRLTVLRGIAAGQETHPVGELPERSQDVPSAHVAPD